MNASFPGDLCVTALLRKLIGRKRLATIFLILKSKRFKQYPNMLEHEDKKMRDTVKKIIELYMTELETLGQEKEHHLQEYHRQERERCRAEMEGSE